MAITGDRTAAMTEQGVETRQGQPDERRGRVAALVLAAGASSRMGELKALLPFGGSTLLERAVRTFLDAGLPDVTVVIGHEADRVRDAVAALDVRCVENPAPERGMYSSVVAGIASLDPGVDAAFVLPADMPAVRAGTVARLAREHGAAQPAVTYPAFVGRRGHPPLVSRQLFDEILRGSGEGGLRGVLTRFEDRARIVPVLDEGVVLDLDTPGDVAAASADFQDRSLPSPGECMALLADRRLDERIVRHCRAVAEVAQRISGGLSAAGVPIEVALVRAAALLHDAGKGQPDHAAAGARLLSDLGFGRVASVIRTHQDLCAGGRDHLDEAALVYLADKLVLGDRVVSLEERFEAAARKHTSPEARQALARRRHDATGVAGRIEAVLGAGWLARLPAELAAAREERRGTRQPDAVTTITPDGRD